MKNQNPSQQSGGRSKNPPQDRMERRRRTLRRKAKRAAGGGVRLAEDVALKGAAISLRVARMVVQRVGRVDDGPRRKRINVAD